MSGALLSALAIVGLAAAAKAQPPVVHRSGNTYFIGACPPVTGLNARCTADIVTDKFGKVLKSPAEIQGYTAADLLSAYNLPSRAGITSTIIALVDAYGYPTAETDLAVYRAQMGLPPCNFNNGCFHQVNQKGGKKLPPPNSGWDVEQGLDIEMASAVCPRCTIYLVEARTSSFKDLGTAVDEAATLGAYVISNSYCGVESKGVRRFANYYNHSGVAITAANGDDGYAAGVCAPADMPTVIAVGGTTLTTANNARGWSETVWSGTGSGCSAYFAKPSWQTDPNCPTRMVGDTAAVADPDTGVAEYEDGSWFVVGGTSVATPLIGAVFAVNDGGVNAAESIYENSSDLFDVTSGSNGTCPFAYWCNGEVGYDGPTGMGTPNGIDAF